MCEKSFNDKIYEIIIIYEYGLICVFKVNM